MGTAGITIQFKEYGVRLNFTPTIMADGLIHLKVAPEVSSLDFTNALTIQGFTIPALSTRRVESEMDLRDGQSFAIAGLVDNQVQTQLEKIPGIGDIPDARKAFPKPVEYQKQRRAAGDRYAPDRSAADGRASATRPGVPGAVP